MTLFNSKPDPLDGFDVFWSLFPRDRRRAGRKSGKDSCKVLWRVRKLYVAKSQILEALKQDIKDIKKGSYAKGDDRMHFFPGIKPWLNQAKYDRDVEEPKKKEPPVSPPQDYVQMTPEEFERLKPHFRRLAKIMEKP